MQRLDYSLGRVFLEGVNVFANRAREDELVLGYGDDASAESISRYGSDWVGVDCDGAGCGSE